MTDTITYFATLISRDDTRDELIELLKACKKSGDSPKYPGTTFFHISQDQTDKNRFLIFELYKDQESLEAVRAEQSFKDLIAFVYQQKALVEDPHIEKHDTIASGDVKWT